MLQLPDIVWAKASLIKDRRECFESERSRVTRHGGAASGIVAETEVTAARTHNHKSTPLQFSQQFVGGEPRKPRQPTCSTCDGNFDMLQSRTGVAWRNVHALLKHIFEAKTYRVAGVVERLFNRVAFRNNAWQSGNNSRVPPDFGVRLQHDRKNPGLRHNVNLKGGIAAALRRTSRCIVGTGPAPGMVDGKGPRAIEARGSLLVRSMRSQLTPSLQRGRRGRSLQNSYAVSGGLYFDSVRREPQLDMSGVTSDTLLPKGTLMPNNASFAETPLDLIFQHAAVGAPKKCISCGRPISWTRQRDAAARGRTACYCSGNCRQTMQKRRQRKRAISDAKLQ